MPCRALNTCARTILAIPGHPRAVNISIMCQNVILRYVASRIIRGRRGTTNNTSQNRMIIESTALPKKPHAMPIIAPSRATAAPVVIPKRRATRAP